MRIQIKTLIIGSGIAGSILQKEIGNDSLIVEKSFQRSNNDYVVLLHKPSVYAKDEKISVVTNKHASGGDCFESEFSAKVYNDTIDIDTAYDKSRKTIGYEVNAQSLCGLRRYCNVDITKIDIDKKLAYGYVVNMGKEVVIEYERIVSTIPLPVFCKISGTAGIAIDNNVFISYFPVGVKKKNAITCSDTMKIDYYSDFEIPYYRTQHYKNSIYYEFCLNKKMDIRFDTVIKYGKFIKNDPADMERYYNDLISKGVFLIGRFGTWDTDFLLHQLVESEDTPSRVFIDTLKKELL